MKWCVIAIISLFLTACTLSQSTFQLPQQVHFQGQTYVKATESHIDEMRHLLYLPEQSKRDPEHWQTGFLFFLDKNSTGRTLAQRVALRQQTFANQPQTQAKLSIVGDELRSEVIYPPTERFHNIQLEVSRGRNLTCGYGQMQFSDKRSISDKNLQNTKNYLNEINQLAQQFAELVWQIRCQ